VREAAVQHESQQVSDGQLIGATALNLLLTAAEVVGGLVSGSLMLLADALHNFSDCASLLIAFVARRISRRRANRQYTFGFRRADLIGAMINLTALVILAIYLVVEAIVRFLSPQRVAGGTVVALAVVALVVDVATALLLRTMARGSMGVRAAFLHNVSDALASVATLAGGAAIWVWHINVVDPAVTLAVTGFVLLRAIPSLRETATILMEGTPEGLDVEAVLNEIRGLKGVCGVHHLHVWRLDERKTALDAHIVIDEADADAMGAIKEAIKQRLREGFHITHSTLEFEVEQDTRCNDDRKVIPPH
jgi:cobalt-zinc-cadmium efflux system protein